MEITLSNVSKSFGSNKVIEKFSFSFNKGIYAILGKNGSGKSTLLKIIGNLISPSSGKVIYDIKKNYDVTKTLFFCAPYQELISELTVKEFLKFHFKFRNPTTNYNNILKEFKLDSYVNHQIENLSSGSIQKLKLVISFFSDSEFILLDEPTTNLDHEGKKTYLKVLKELSSKKVIIIATNDKDDYLTGKTSIINLDN
jgi:ABC-type multidrug transport system ATPase subunit|tara:strand:+ start:680 stop:1273 length:594 start_codon:yes stop_codon:yes gene_type:complete